MPFRSLALPLAAFVFSAAHGVLEYTRPTDKTSGRPMNPGRILELSW